MPNFNPITDLRPVDQDRPSEISAQELQTMKVNLMETTMKTKQIVDVLIRHNSLLERDIEKIADLKRRLRDTNPTIPSLPGWAGFLLGAGVDLGGGIPLPSLGGKKFMPPGKVRDKVPTLVPEKVKSLKALKAKVSVKSLKSKAVNLLNAVKIKAALPPSELQQVITSSKKKKVLDLVEAKVDQNVLKEKTSKALTSGVNNINNKTNKILKSNTTSGINSGIKSVTPKSSVKGLLTGSDATGDNIKINKNKNNIKINKKINKINSNKVFNLNDKQITKVLTTHKHPITGEILSKEQLKQFMKTKQLPINPGKSTPKGFVNKLKTLKLSPGSLVKGAVIGTAIEALAQWAIFDNMDRMFVEGMVRKHGYDKTYKYFVAELEKELAKKDHGGWMTAGNILTLGIAGFVGEFFGYKDYENMRKLIGYVNFLIKDEERLRKMSKNNGHVSINPLEGSKINNIASASSVPFSTESLNLNTRSKDVIVVLTDNVNAIA